MCSYPLDSLLCFSLLPRFVDMETDSQHESGNTLILKPGWPALKLVFSAVPSSPAQPAVTVAGGLAGAVSLLLEEEGPFVF